MSDLQRKHDEWHALRNTLDAMGKFPRPDATGSLYCASAECGEALAAEWHMSGVDQNGNNAEWERSNPDKRIDHPQYEVAQAMTMLMDYLGEGWTYDKTYEVYDADAVGLNAWVAELLAARVYGHDEPMEADACVQEMFHYCGGAKHMNQWMNKLRRRYGLPEAEEKANE